LIAAATFFSLTLQNFSIDGFICAHHRKPGSIRADPIKKFYNLQNKLTHVGAFAPKTDRVNTSKQHREPVCSTTSYRRNFLDNP